MQPYMAAGDCRVNLGVLFTNRKSHLTHSESVRYQKVTCHNSADSVPASYIAIRTTFRHIINFASIINYTCRLVIDIQCIRFKMPETNVFNELCVKITLLRFPNKF